MSVERPQIERNIQLPVVISENRVEPYEDFAGALRTQGLNVNFEPLSSKEDKWGLLKVLGNSGKLVYQLYGKPRAIEALQGCVAEYERVAGIVSEAASKVESANEAVVLAGKAKQMVEQIRKGYLFSKHIGNDFHFLLLVLPLTKHL